MLSLTSSYDFTTELLYRPENLSYNTPRLTLDDFPLGKCSLTIIQQNISSIVSTVNYAYMYEVSFKKINTLSVKYL